MFPVARERLEIVREPLSSRQQLKDQEAEIREWRNDAEGLAASNQRYAELMGGRDEDEQRLIEQHAALMEKYPDKQRKA